MSPDNRLLPEEDIREALLQSEAEDINEAVPTPGLVPTPKFREPNRQERRAAASKQRKLLKKLKKSISTAKSTR